MKDYYDTNERFTRCFERIVKVQKVVSTIEVNLINNTRSWHNKIEYYFNS